MNEWQPIETAPKDGTVFKALTKDGEEVLARWTEDRVCAGSHVPNGHFGPGWEDPEVKLGHFNESEPTHWIPA